MRREDSAQLALDFIDGYTRQLRTLIPAAKQHIRTELAHIDGMRATASGADTGGGSGSQRVVTIDEPCTGYRRCTSTKCADRDTRHEHPCRVPGEHEHRVAVPVTAVEAASMRRTELAHKLTDWDDRLDATAKVLAALIRDARRTIGTRTEAPRCDGGVGYEGYLIPDTEGGWSNTDCHEIPDVGRKTCNKCRAAAAMWKRRRQNPAA
jgi:hypothetical protein